MVLHLLSSLKKVIMLSIQLYTLNINLEFFLKSEHKKRYVRYTALAVQLFDCLEPSVKIFKYPEYLSIYSLVIIKILKQHKLKVLI